MPLTVLGSVLLAVIAFSPVTGAKTTPLHIEAYPDQLSYQPGDSVQLHVSTSVKEYALSISRRGAESTLVTTVDRIKGASYPIPENASSHGCDWPVGYRFEIPSTWISGYYEITLTASDQGGPYVHRNHRTASTRLFFIVRSANPGKQSRILLQLATNTYNAYNNWGGSSLYAYHGRSKLQGHRVSFDRPLTGFFSKWELPFIAWAEENGYRLDYAVNSDLEHRPEILKNYNLCLLYTSPSPRD